MKVSDVLTEQDKKLFEYYFNKGVNIQTNHDDYDGKVDVDALLPFIQEGLPSFLNVDMLGIEENKVVVTCEYNGEALRIYMVMD